MVNKKSDPPENSKFGLYVHFPLCNKKCPYCHFASVPFRKELVGLWREGLEKESQLYSGLKNIFDTLYIGGGTPSLLSPDELAGIGRSLGDRFHLDLLEFTLEANPEMKDAAALEGWRQAGVTRLSLGIQSFDDRILGLLGRDYSASQAAEFAASCRAAGFDNISLDLMIGVPSEERKSIEDIPRRLDVLKPEHVSLYIMEQLEGLPFEEFFRLHAPDDDFVADEYAFLQKEMEARGLRQYEISNFARPGKECLHNLKYWRYEPFLGLGPSACSHLGNRRWCHEAEIRTWAYALRNGQTALSESFDLSPEESLKEALVFGLRQVEGIKPSEFRERWGVDILERFGPALADLEHEGFIDIGLDSIRIKKDKLLLSNRVFVRLV